jgi:carboxymethylenebutenolidase
VDLDTITTSSVMIPGAGGDEIEVYLALPAGDGPFPGVVVIHHLPGFDRATKEIARRFATMGYSAAMPNLYWREAPGAAPDDAAATARASGGVPDERLVGDVRGAAAFLRARPNANGKVGAIGYCSGGRQAFLSGIEAGVDATVDCYGAFVTGVRPEGHPLNVVPLTDRIADLACPVLGLFGAEDKYPSPEHVAQLEQLLTAHGKTFEIHSYPDAGHAFFAVDRPSYRVAAANDGWQRIAAFFGTYLGQ